MRRVGFLGDCAEGVGEGLDADFIEREEKRFEVLLDGFGRGGGGVENVAGDAWKQFLKQLGLGDEGVLVEIKVAVEERGCGILALGGGCCVVA